MLELHLSNKTRKFLDKCNDELFSKIDNILNDLKSNPFPKGFRKIEGTKEKAFRIRSGGFRIIYSILKDKNSLVVLNIDKRSRVYD